MQFKRNVIHRLQRRSVYHKTIEPPTAEDAEESESESAEESDADDSAESKKEAAQPKTGKTFTQDEVNDMIKKRLAKEDERRKRETEAAQQKAEADKLKESKEFEALAEKRETQLKLAEATVESLQAERDALVESVDKYKAVIASLLEAQIKELPETHADLLSRLDPLEQLEWIAQNRDKLSGTKRSTKSLPPTPKGDETGLTDEQKQAASARTKSLYQSSF